MKRMMMAALLLCLAPCAISQQLPPAANTAAAADRDLWLGDEARFVRRWLLLGPLSAAQADQVAKAGHAALVAGAAPGSEIRVGDTSFSWRAQGSYGDVLDGFSAAGMKDGDAGLVLATVVRASAGKARLLLGGNVRGVWVNDAWIGGRASSPAFVIDGWDLEVALPEGENRILLRVERVDRPVLVTLRVVEPGFAEDRSGNVAPYLLTADAGKLPVKLGAGAGNPGAEVLYQLLLPNGGVVQEIRAPRDREAAFGLQPAWPDGPYEVRVSTRAQDGTPTITYLPWYHGDIDAGLRQLLDAAAAPGSDAHVQMLADMARDRADGDWRALHSPLMEFAELRRERAGQTGPVRAGGFVRLSWVDDVDGSTQFCRAYLPEQYTATRPAPALLFLHGYNHQNPPYVRWRSNGDRHNGVAQRHDLVVLEPTGRGNVDYRWMGERDVLRCLSEARRRLAIDPDRVYLTGESMGGNGTWLIASRHPQEFAAIAPVYGGHDYRIGSYGYSYTNPQATRPMENFVQEMHASFTGAEGLLHVPVYALHGAADTAVPVEQSRHGVKLLQRWGYDVRYREFPGRGHEDLKARDEIAQWLLQHQRVTAPREVRLRAWDLAGAQAHWMRVTGREDPLRMIEARAILIDPRTIRVDTRNVTRLELTPPGLSGADAPAADGPTVIWNGRRQAMTGGSRVLALAADAEAPRTGPHRFMKTPAREGRLSYFFDTPFVIVTGTSSRDPALNAALAAKAAALADLWERWQHARPRMLRDTEVTPQIERQYSLLLLGGAEANRVSARLGSKVPLKVSRDTVEVDGRKFAARDAVAQAIYPHPQNEQRYLLLVEPTSVAGLRFWNPQQYWHALNGFPLNLWDWNIVDGRHVLQSPGQLPDRGWIAAGIFDMHWRRDDRFTVLGEADTRDTAHLRHAPAAGFTLPAESLDTLVGRYRIDPGQIGGGGLIRVTRSDNLLNATAPENGRDWPLEAEEPDHFAIVGLGTPVSFRRAADGRVAGMVYHYNGQEIVATRVPAGD